VGEQVSEIRFLMHIDGTELFGRIKERHIRMFIASYIVLHPENSSRHNKSPSKSFSLTKRSDSVCKGRLEGAAFFASRQEFAPSSLPLKIQPLTGAIG
jgi:hypothetical protein